MEVKQSSSTRELYRNLAMRLRNLIVKPASEWKLIQQESAAFNDLLSGFSLPLIGLVAITTFINFLINQQALIFELALKQALLVFVALFGGVFSVFYVVYRLLKLFQKDDFKEEAAQLAVYASAPLYVVSIVTALVPEIFFIQVFSLYSFYLAWVGIQSMPRIPADKKLICALLVGGLVLVIPFLLRLLFLNLLSI